MVEGCEQEGVEIDGLAANFVLIENLVGPASFISELDVSSGTLPFELDLKVLLGLERKPSSAHWS